jgi:hypothetical protein
MLNLIEMFLRSILQNGFITVLACHLTSDQNLEETPNIKCLFPTTNGQSNLVGTEQKRDYYQKLCQKRKMSVIFAS